MHFLRSVVLSLLVGALLLAAPGMAQDQPNFDVVIPGVKDVAAIHIEIYKTTRTEGYELKLTQADAIQPVLDWLKSIDFDRAKGWDGKALKLGHFGRLEIMTKDGKSQGIGLSGGLVVVRGFLWGADTDKLLPILKKARGK